MYLRHLQKLYQFWLVLSFATLNIVVNSTLKVQAAGKSQAPVPTVKKFPDYPQKHFSKKLKRISKLTNVVSVETFESIDNTQMAQSPQIIQPYQGPRDSFPTQRQSEPKRPPPPEELLKPSPQSPNFEEQPINIPGTVTIQQFEVKGSTIFTKEELDAVTKEFTNRPITFKELTEARNAITKLYTAGCNSNTSNTDDKWKPLLSRLGSKTKPCYVNSGAYIPQQEFEDGGKVKIKVIEGELEEEIKVTGTKRLKHSYIRSRLAIATGKPLNLKRLKQALQLLRLNPLIENISAELSASTRPDKSFLRVDVKEAPSFKTELNTDNRRSPSVGSFRRGMQFTQRNLLGFGDGLSLSYTNTEGSNGIGVNYTLPLNSRNTTLDLAYGTTNSDVIEPPFDVLGIESNSRYYELTLRHPFIQTPTQQFDIGLNLSRRESETSLSFDNIGPFPISAGADERGRTRVSAVRFFQQWTRSRAKEVKEVLAFRSQFSVGLDALNSTINSNVPDSRFFAWRGQGQWLRLIDNDAELLLRGEIQLADNSLLSIEQFGIGGLDSVRGYRQDALLTDNGVLASAELRLPILRVSKVNGVLQLTPFIEFGSGWNNNTPNPETSTLLSTGLGLRWRMDDYFLARFDWGIPLVSFSSSERTLQEQGLYFSVLWNPF